MGVGGLRNDLTELEFTALFGTIFSTVLAMDLHYLMKVAWPVIGPMLVGAIPTALASWFMFYFLSAFVLKSVHRRRLELFISFCDSRCVRENHGGMKGFSVRLDS